jgi:hypothetical protein
MPRCNSLLEVPVADLSRRRRRRHQSLVAFSSSQQRILDDDETSSMTSQPLSLFPPTASCRSPSKWWIYLAVIFLSIANSAEHADSFPFLTRILANKNRHTTDPSSSSSAPLQQRRRQRQSQRRQGGTSGGNVETLLVPSQASWPPPGGFIPMTTATTTDASSSSSGEPFGPPLRPKRFDRFARRKAHKAAAAAPVASLSSTSLSSLAALLSAEASLLTTPASTNSHSFLLANDTATTREGRSSSLLAMLDVRTDDGAATTKTSAKNKRRRAKAIVTTAAALQHCVLDQGMPLKSVQVRIGSAAGAEDEEAPSTGAASRGVADATTSRTEIEANIQLQQHDVVQLMARRFHSRSTPGHRAANDTAKLALSLEGGGMRGAVSAGMAAAICTLGLSDAFDGVYGSSAGSVIGAYMVSRQMCLDVYLDILPAAQRTFVCTQRILRALARNAVDLAVSQTQRLRAATSGAAKSNPSQPGMNISFVLDGIMDHDAGIRPLDLERFRLNDQKQPLRIVSSAVMDDGRLVTKCFGSRDFFPADSQHTVARRVDGIRQGIYACLEASMTVPGATGPPVEMLVPSENPKIGNSMTRGVFFDAFCFEPLPYRSAVEEGASHVLVLCSRPEGYQPVTAPGVYEQLIAPLYFHSHNQPAVAKFFENGGQQYIYAEDLLTLEQGKESLESPVPVPPPRVLYGSDDLSDESRELRGNRDQWKKAHLLPLKVPLGTPELATLEQDRATVIRAIRGGFAAAFDLFAPAVGVQVQGNLTGMQVAELVFPDSMLDDQVLERQIRVRGDEILRRRPPPPPPLGRGEDDMTRTLSVRNIGRRWRNRRRRQAKPAPAWMRTVLRRVNHRRDTSAPGDASTLDESSLLLVEGNTLHQKQSDALQHHNNPKGSNVDAVGSDDRDDGITSDALRILSSLPGLQDGRMAHLARGLHSSSSSSSSSSQSPEEGQMKA